MRIRIPVHPAFLEKNNGVIENAEKAIKKSTKKMKQYSLILNFMADENGIRHRRLLKFLDLKIREQRSY